jgi:aminocarboxymuconate-semialdehyde decarboxylase
MIIDFHNHFYPPEYLKAVAEGPSNVRVTYDDRNNPLLHYPGDYNIVVPAHRDIAVRAEILEREGIDRQVLTLTTPGTHIESPARAVELARLVNDSLARIAQAQGSRFAALATLPLNHPEAAADELDRAVNKLGFKGAMLFSNINQISLSDTRFWRLYAKADALGAVFSIHPEFPAGVEAMTEYWLMPLLGFPFDTTLAAAKLVFSGVVDRFPNITWVLAHLGGAAPYLAERLDRGYEAFKECRENIGQPPSRYLKRFYYDTVNFDRNALRLAVDFAGAGHLLAGSDFPHQIGSLRRMVDSLDGLEISAQEKVDILGGNAARLLGL